MKKLGRNQPEALPDLDDADYAAKLQPLRDAVVPAGRRQVEIGSGSETHTTGHPDVRLTDRTKSRTSVAKHLENIEQIRGPKRRFEFLIPIRVGEALAKDATARGQSAATRLLEVLRDAGYPVIPEDFVDLRKEKGRG